MVKPTSYQRKLEEEYKDRARYCTGAAQSLEFKHTVFNRVR